MNAACITFCTIGTERQLCMQEVHEERQMLWNIAAHGVSSASSSDASKIHDSVVCVIILKRVSQILPETMLLSIRILLDDS